MKIVLLEGLGVSDKVLEKHAARLKEMGHTFAAYEKDASLEAQEERHEGWSCRKPAVQKDCGHRGRRSHREEDSCHLQSLWLHRDCLQRRSAEAFGYCV